MMGLVLVLMAGRCASFLVLPSPTTTTLTMKTTITAPCSVSSAPERRDHRHTWCEAQKKNYGQEFSVIEDEEDYITDEQLEEGNAVAMVESNRNEHGDLMIKIQTDFGTTAHPEDYPDRSESTASNNNSPRPGLEYAVLRPGTVVRIQVGDPATARKAWKKRRRTKSPLLVPCSIVTVEHLDMVRWNLVFLLEKFGSQERKQQPGIALSASELARYYRSYLKSSSLTQQATRLGYPTISAMLRDVFPPHQQARYGVVLEERDEPSSSSTSETMLYLTAPIYRRKAQQRASTAAPMLQFQPEQHVRTQQQQQQQDEDNEEEEDSAESLVHTGWVRVRQDTTTEVVDATVTATKTPRRYSFLPLSACLRVSQLEDIDTGRIYEGKELAALVYDYDALGDGGSPLMTLSLKAGTSAGNSPRQRLKLPSPHHRQKNSPPKTLAADAVQHQFRNLQVGDGPFRATVVKLEGNRKRALVDFGVGRTTTQATTTKGKGKASRDETRYYEVLGSLRFQDSVDFATGARPQEKEKETIEDYDYDDAEDTEQIISASIEELYQLDEEEEEEDETDENTSSPYLDTIADDLLSLRTNKVEEGTYEDGEVEEDISQHYRIDERTGQLMYTDPVTGERTTITEDEDDDLDDEDEDDADEDDVEDTDDDFNIDEDDSGITDSDMAMMFTENDKDGSITFHDPETGESLVVTKKDAEYEGMQMMKALIDDDLNKEQPTHTTATSASSVISATNTKMDQEIENGTVSSNPNPTKKAENHVQLLQSKKIQIGDTIDVYISSVLKQSNTFRVTTNPCIRGQKAKDIKKEEGVNKRLQRLTKKYGPAFLDRMYQLEGTECTGIVTAVSNTGAWLYVQPHLHDENEDDDSMSNSSSTRTELPVGIGELVTSEADGDLQLTRLSAGDKVRVQLSGIDQERGQISMKVLNKV